MNELYWIWLTEVANVPPREGRAVEVAGRQLAVFNLGDRVLVIDNACPHKGGPLADGIVAGASVVCPLHAWKVNLEAGTVERPAGIGSCVQAYPARIDRGVVVVGLPAHFLVPAEPAAACPGREAVRAATLA
jgi:nitrite reductase (NADH) small subunit